MELPKSRQLKSAASNSITNAKNDPRKLVAFYTLVMLMLSLALLAVDYVLERQIGNTGGLDGVGLRSILTTVQTVLQWAQVIALPFLQFGWLFATVKIARGEETEKADLLQGFRQFFPFLRLTVLKSLIFMGLAFGAAYAGAFVVVMTPLGNPMMGLLSSDLTLLTEEQLLAQMEQVMVPMMSISAVVALVIVAPFFYRFRMAEYVMLDSKCGARAALRGSRMLMKGNMWRLMGLDLSFWWFFLLSVVVAALAYTDMLLPLFGVELPWSYDVSYFAAFLLAAVAQLALNYFCRAHIDVTYAHAYLSLLPKEEIYESH